MKGVNDMNKEWVNMSENERCKKLLDEKNMQMEIMKESYESEIRELKNKLREKDNVRNQIISW